MNTILTVPSSFFFYNSYIEDSNLVHYHLEANRQVSFMSAHCSLLCPNAALTSWQGRVELERLCIECNFLTCSVENTKSFSALDYFLLCIFAC